MIPWDHDYYELPAEPISIRRRVSAISTGIPEKEKIEKPTRKRKSEHTKYNFIKTAERREIDKNSKDFTRIHNVTLRNPELKPDEKILLLVLESHIFGANGTSKGYCYPSIDTLIYETGIKSSKIYEALKVLEKNKLIERFTDSRPHPTHDGICYSVNNYIEAEQPVDDRGFQPRRLEDGQERTADLPLTRKQKKSLRNAVKNGIEYADLIYEMPEHKKDIDKILRAIVDTLASTQADIKIYDDYVPVQVCKNVFDNIGKADVISVIEGISFQDMKFSRDSILYFLYREVSSRVEVEERIKEIGRL